MRSRLFHLALIATTALFTAALAAGCGDDDDNADFCQDNCQAVVDAACTNGPTDMAGCLEGCQAAQSACPAEFGTLAECAGSPATFVCGAADSPEPPGCATENAALTACVAGGGNNPYCQQVCPAVIAPGCANGPTDLADCLTGCNIAATGCPDEFSALQQCAGDNATFSCDADDSPAPDGCETQNDALNACLAAID